jgi:hypothetical protein
MDYSVMDGSTRFKLGAELRRELNEEGTSDARHAEILKELKKLALAGKQKAVKKQKEPKYLRDMETPHILGGIILDRKTLLPTGRHILQDKTPDEVDQIMRDRYGDDVFARKP